MDIFEIRKGFYNKKPPCYENGNIPFIGATDSNNGITGFSDYETIDANSKIGYGPNESIDRKIFPGNAICVTNNGSVGYAYYQPSEFTCTHDVNPLYLKNIALNRHLAMFLIACIEKQRVCFTYARKWRPKRMVHSKLMLPIDEAEQPDWSFMENFMKEVENDALNTTLSYFADKQSITPPVKSSNELKYKEFDIQSIFNILPGKRLTKSNMVQGKRPFIGATDSFLNNGITEWVDNYNESLDKNCLGVNYNGSVGETFYHPYSCIFSDDVKRLHLKSSSASHYTMLFLKTAILQQKEKYAYGYKFNEKRMLKQIITLPATPDGSPDWDYMESYMRHHEAQHILSAIQHFQSRS